MSRREEEERLACQTPEGLKKLWDKVDDDSHDGYVAVADYINRLYMRRADLLDDEFEGTTPAFEIARWERLADEAPTDVERRMIRGNREQLSNFAQVFRPTYYLICWCMSEYENIAMWERYVTSNSTDGVAIRSTFAALKSELETPTINVGVVRYIDYDREAFGQTTMNVVQHIMHKRIFYVDEREVRGVVFSMAAEPLRLQYVDPFLTSDKSGFLANVNVKELIKGVVLHPRATTALSQKVSAMCDRYGLPAPVRSAMSSTPQF
jgi:hypothetical protein